MFLARRAGQEGKWRRATAKLRYLAQELSVRSIGLGPASFLGQADVDLGYTQNPQSQMPKEPLA